MARWDEPDDLPPPQAFLDAMRAVAARSIAFADQWGARTRTRRTQVLCKRCNGPYLLAGLRADPEGDCGCEQRCERAGCLGPGDGPVSAPDHVPDNLCG